MTRKNLHEKHLVEDFLRSSEEFRFHSWGNGMPVENPLQKEWSDLTFWKGYFGCNLDYEANSARQETEEVITMVRVREDGGLSQGLEYNGEQCMNLGTCFR